MNPYNTIILGRSGPVAVIRLNRPDKHNAITFELADELVRCLDDLETADDVRVIVLTGAGDKAFCVGADMSEVVSSMEAADDRRERAMFSSERLLQVKKPIIAAVNGYAYGGGAVYAINCDIRICSENAKFRFVGASYGLVVGSSHLPRIVGASTAKELILTARPVDAREALRIGLANHVVRIEDLEPTVLAMAQEIANHSAAALAASKEVIDVASSTGDAVERERELNSVLRQSDEHARRFQDATDRVTKRRDR